MTPRPVRYSLIAPVDGRCHCGSNCFANRHTRFYYMVRFQIGDRFEVTWWMGKN